MNLANMKRSETTEQIGLINWARANEEYVPELRLLHHIPNEGIRTNGPAEFQQSILFQYLQVA